MYTLNLHRAACQLHLSESESKSTDSLGIGLVLGSHSVAFMAFVHYYIYYWHKIVHNIFLLSFKNCSFCTKNNFFILVIYVAFFKNIHQAC